MANTKGTTRELVYQILKSEILSFTYQPGQGISEYETAQKLQVSRTPVREAFIKLSQENLLDIFPQKGTYVTLIDSAQVEESKFVRHTLEREIVQQACCSFPREELFQMQSHLVLQELCIEQENYMKFFELDEALHGTLFRGCRKERTWLLLQQMNNHYNRVRVLNLSEGYDWVQLLHQHRELLRAINEKNPELGLKVIDEHLNKVVFDLDHLKKHFEHYFVKHDDKIVEVSSFTKSMSLRNIR